MQKNEKNIKKIGKNAFLIRKQQRYPQRDQVITLNACFDQNISLVWILGSKY